MRPIRWMVYTLLLAGWCIGLHAGELSEEARRDIEGEVQKIAALSGEDLPARKQAALVALMKRYEGQPLPELWALRVYYYIVVNPEAWKEGGAQLKNNWLAQLDAWPAGRDLSEAAKVRHRALRLRILPIADFRTEAPIGLPGMDAVAWEPYESDYFYVSQRMLQDALDRNHAVDFNAAWARWLVIANRYADHPRVMPPLLETLSAAWRKRPGVLPPTELVALLKPTTQTLVDADRLDAKGWEAIVPSACRVADEAGDVVFAEALFARAAEKFPDAPTWLLLARSRHAQAQGQAEAASALRAQTVAKALAAAAPQTTSASEALREEFDAAFAAERWPDALGAARGLFNMAKSEAELARSLDYAGRVLVAQGGGVAPTLAFLGLVREGEAATLPEAWRTACVNAAWRKALTDVESADDEALLQPATWRRRAWKALAVGDGAAALAAAGVAYRLPDPGFASQQATLEVAGLAVRAHSGSLLAAADWVKAQTEATAKPFALPVSNPAPSAAETAAAAWKNLMAQAGGNAPSASLLSAFFDYAAALTLAGRTEEALGVMRRVYDWSLDAKEFDQASAGVASVLRALDGNLARANAWLAFQKSGPSGPDGKPGTADDATDPLAGVAVKVPPEWTAGWTDLSDGARNRGDLKSAIRWRLLAGAIDGAKALTRTMRLGLPFEESAWKSHLSLAGAVLKAANGHTFGGQPYADFLRYGAAGLDEKPGTPDDLADPLTPAK